MSATDDGAERDRLINPLADRFQRAKEYDTWAREWQAERHSLGLYQKYTVVRTDGKPIPDEARFFVLRYDKDPPARAALAAYADSCEEDNPTLAADLRDALAALGEGER